MVQTNTFIYFDKKSSRSLASTAPHAVVSQPLLWSLPRCNGHLAGWLRSLLANPNCPNAAPVECTTDWSLALHLLEVPATTYCSHPTADSTFTHYKADRTNRDRQASKVNLSHYKTIKTGDCFSPKCFLWSQVDMQPGPCAV